jgi:hypothetical protein
LASRPARAAALGADAFISIHHDSTQPRYLSKWTTEDCRTASYSDNFRGYGVFYSDKNKQAAKSLLLARLVGGAMRASGVPFSPHHAENVPGEGRPIVDRADGVYLHRELRVLKLASMPALLLEAGVIVNRQEQLEIASANRRLNTARAVASAFAEFCTSVNAVVGWGAEPGRSLAARLPLHRFVLSRAWVRPQSHAGTAIRAWAGQRVASGAGQCQSKGWRSRVRGRLTQ